MTQPVQTTSPSGHRRYASLVHLVVAVVFTWPLALRMRDRLPIGAENEPTVPQFNLWSLRWTAEHFPLSWSRWWDAPIFWPRPGSYARSELQPLTGLVFGVLRWAGNDTIAYGTIIVVALALNGVAVSVLARRLGVGVRAATVVGIIAQTVPFLSQQLGVLQLTMIWPVLFALAAAIDWARVPRLRSAAFVGAWVAVGAWTCSYHVALGCLAAMAALPVMVQRSWITHWRERVGGLVLAASIAGALIAPIAIGQDRRLGSTTWTVETITSGSARWADLAPGGRYWAGTGLVVLGVLGAIAARRQRATWALVLMIAVATLLSTGTRLSLGGVQPYRWLAENVTTIGRMRSPFRATALVQVLPAVVAAPAIEAMVVRRATWRSIRPVGTTALVLATLAAIDPGAGRLVTPPDSTTTWSTWLAVHPGGAVAMMPMPVERPASAFEQTTSWMLIALDHGHPLVNGYTGFFPGNDRSFRLRMQSFPDRATIDELRDLGVRYVVADSSWWTGERDRAATEFGLVPVLGGPGGRLLDLGEPGN